MTIREEVRRIAIGLLKNSSTGLKFGELVHEINHQGGYKKNTIQGNIWDLDKKYPKQVYKAGRGLFKHTDYRDEDFSNESGKTKNIKEEDFYRPFANWLENEVEEATIAIPLGGNKFGNKWGTPDVVGKKESKRSDIIKGGTEIVSAEIKSNTSQLITAFGQACAYKLFSHKCYLVVPKQSSQEDLDRLDSQVLFGCSETIIARRS